MTSPRTLLRRAGSVSILVIVVLMAAAVAAPHAALAEGVSGPASTPGTSSAAWTWPLAGARIVAAYRAPAHAYGPGHRGIDLAPASGPSVRAPDEGVVAFAGQVAGRGILTIAHPGDLVSTLEPVSTTLAVGDVVEAGQAVAMLSTGGHTTPGALHLGARRHGVYINPLTLLGGVPRAVLLPCCT